MTTPTPAPAPSLWDGLERTQNLLGDVQDIALADLPAVPAIFVPDPTLIASVQAIGVVQPILVSVDFGALGYKRIVDGNRRLAAARAAGLTTIPVIAVDDSERHAALTLTLNVARKPNPLAEYRAVAALLEAGETLESIANALRRPLAQVKRYLRFAQLPASILAAFRAEMVPFSLAEQVLSAPPSARAQLGARVAKGEKLTHAMISEARSAAAIQTRDALPPGLFKPTERSTPIATPATLLANLTPAQRDAVQALLVAAVEASSGPEPMPGTTDHVVATLLQRHLGWTAKDAPRDAQVAA